MAQQKNQNKPTQTEAPKTPTKGNEDPNTFGKEPPMVDPQTPDHPGEYEVNADQSGNTTDEKPTLH